MLIFWTFYSSLHCRLDTNGALSWLMCWNFGHYNQQMLSTQKAWHWYVLKAVFPLQHETAQMCSFPHVML